MTLRSHTAAEILAAYRRGETICVLDSRTHGADDVLIGRIADCKQAVIENEDENVFETQDWRIFEIGDGDEPLRSIIDADEAGQ